MSLFYCYDSSRNHQAHKGLYFRHLNDKLGEKYFYTKQELLSIDKLSNTIRNQIETAKPGTKIKLRKLHATGDLCITLLTPEQTFIVEDIQAIKDDIRDIDKEIARTIPDLLAKKRHLKADLDHKRKKLNIKFTP